METWTLVEEEPEMTKYLRFGDIPENGKSKIWRGEECVGEEEGVSVYEIRLDKDKHISICLPFPFHRDTLDTLCVLTKYDNRPCYTVTGEYVGKGTDGEPLISNVQIEEEFPKIISDEKMKQMGEEISKAAVDNIRERFNKIVEPELVDLEKAAEEYADKHGFRVPYDGSNNFYDDVDVKASLEGFKAGARWMEEQGESNNWKPTKEQIEYLSKAILTLGEEGDGKTTAVLNGLRKDLKNL